MILFLYCPLAAHIFAVYVGDKLPTDALRHLHSRAKYNKNQVLHFPPGLLYFFAALMI